MYWWEKVLQGNSCSRHKPKGLDTILGYACKIVYDDKHSTISSNMNEELFHYKRKATV